MTLQRHEIELSAASIEAIAQRVADLLREARAPRPTLQTAEAMRLLGYDSAKRFWQAVRRLGIPYTRLSPRHCIFRESDINAALERRRVGAQRGRRPRA